MTTPQHPGNTLEIRSSIGTAGAFTLTATDLPRDTVQSIIELVLRMPHSLRSGATPCARCDRPGAHKHPAPTDDYVDQGDEPHDDQPDDHIDPWAHPKHASRCTARSAHRLGSWSCVDVAGHEGPHAWQQQHPLSLG